MVQVDGLPIISKTWRSHFYKISAALRKVNQGYMNRPIDDYPIIRKGDHLLILVDKKLIVNLIAGLIAIATFIIWGWFLLERTWQINDDLDAGFFWSIIPVAIAIWIALYLASA